MKINASIGFVLAAIAGSLLFAACEDYDYEFNLEECTEDWACRTNFGVGYTCTDDGYCVAPQKSVLDPDDSFELTEYCSEAALNFPPEIFRSTSARTSMTLGVITNFAGKQVAYATRLAVGLADIRGGLRLKSGSTLADYKFTVVSCALSDSEAQDDSIVREVAKFLRNDVRVEAILLGLGEDGTDSVIGEITAQDLNAGEPGHTLVISSNNATLRTEAEMQQYGQVWTMATSERNMLRHVGEQLVLRRLQPYAVEACRDSEGNEAEDGTCENPNIESVRDLLLGNGKECEGEGEDENCDDVEIGAYHRYLADHGGEEAGNQKLAHYVVQGLGPDIIISAATPDRQEALESGVRNVLEYLEVPGLTEVLDVKFNLFHLSCGTGCGSRQMQVEILKGLGCGGAELTGGDKVEPNCGTSSENKASAIVLLSDETRLVDSTYNAISGLQGEDAAAQIIYERSRADESGDAETIFVMSPAASSSSTGIYSDDWTAASNVERRDRLFKYVREGRILGVRQSADRSTEPFQSFLSAQQILVDQQSGSSQHYIAQAYDAAWLAMAAIAGSVASLDVSPAASEADIIRAMKLPGAQTHSTTLRKHFSGETPFKLIEQDVDGAKDLEVGRRVLDFIPTQWNDILDTGSPSDQDYPFLKYSHLFSAASGELRFTDSGQDRNYGGRERMSYDYGIWMPTIQDKIVDKAGERVDLDARQCTVGMIAPSGHVQSVHDSGGDEVLFVCPVEATTCSYTEALEKSLEKLTPTELAFCVPMNATQKVPSAFPMPKTLLFNPEQTP